MCEHPISVLFLLTDFFLVVGRECCTDNVNRTLHNIREILTSHGSVQVLLYMAIFLLTKKILFSARLTPVKFMFEHLGRVAVSINKPGPTNLVDKMMNLGIDNMATEMHELGDMETDDYTVMEVKFSYNISTRANHFTKFICQPHQEKPHLLICRNKFESALISRQQADFD